MTYTLEFIVVQEDNAILPHAEPRNRVKVLLKSNVSQTYSFQ
jgi:hypothetical protein